MNSVKLLTIQIYNNLLLCVLELLYKSVECFMVERSVFLWNFLVRRQERMNKRWEGRERDEQRFDSFIKSEDYEISQ